MGFVWVRHGSGVCCGMGCVWVRRGSGVGRVVAWVFVCMLGVLHVVDGAATFANANVCQIDVVAEKVDKSGCASGEILYKHPWQGAGNSVRVTSSSDRDQHHTLL